MLDYKTIIYDLIRDIDILLPETKISTKKRGYAGQVSPSGLGRWTSKKFITMQAAYFFEPSLMAELGIISIPEKEALEKKHEMDVGGYLNCFLGTLSHAIILPSMEKFLRSLGYNFVVELPIYSHKTGVYGTCDAVLFDDENKQIHLMDLKTTGPGIVYKNDVIENEHECQLYAYGKTLEDMFDYEIASISLVSICKTVNSTCWYPTRDGEAVKHSGEMTNPEDYTWIKYKLPLVAQYDTDWKSIEKKRATYLMEVKAEVIRINGIIQQKYPTYKHWLLDGGIPPEYEEKSKEVEKRLDSYCP
jgi:hypothetical protein